MSRVVFVLVLGVLAGCGMSPPTATDASRAHIELADLQRGRSLLVTKCGNCHRPPLPTDHGAHEWPEKLDEMATRANLDVMQGHLIEQYLVTMAMR
jgi:nitrate/TMAO reductase-like tetraheme cytochrome c subunit